jgi:predicted permease
VALAAMRLVMHRLPPEVADVGAIVLTLNWRVFAWMLAAMALTVVLVGLMPALRMTRVAVGEPLKDGAGTTTGRARRYSPLIIAEVALSIALLMGAGLLVKAARHVSGYEFGYDATQLLSAWVNLGSDRPRPADSLAQLLRDVMVRVQHVDGVQSAASITSVLVPGRVVESAVPGGGNRRLLLHQYTVASPDLLRTLGLQLITGRDFTDGDASAGPGAVIVDESVARRLWPTGGAIGAQIRLGDGPSSAGWMPVIGIVRSASIDFQADPDLAPEPAVYAVVRTDAYRFHRIAIRVAGAAQAAPRASIALEVHRAIAAVAPGASGSVSPWQDGFHDFVAGREFIAALFSLFGGLALGLCAVGLYGVLAYTVGQRMREFAIRLALGAARRDVFQLVLHDGAVMVLAGTGIGAVFAMWVAKVLAAWLYGVNPMDAGTLVGAEILLIGISLAACLVPALRAMRAEPLDILRAA